MSDVTLTAATRTNLLAAQDTAALLATTQQRLSTGKKVNSALDNAVSYFTAQGLDSRATALSNLLDGISNSIQTIQAADRGLTNIKKLTDQLTSTAQQALSAQNSFTGKASLGSVALTGAIATNLLATGPTVATANTAIGAASGAAAATTTAGSAYTTLTADATISISGTVINLTNGTDINGAVAAINAVTSSTGVTASIASGKIKLDGTADGAAFNVLASDANIGFGTTLVSAAGTLVPTGSTRATGIGFNAGDTFSVNGKDVTVAATDTLTSLAQKVVAATNGAVSATYDTTTRKFVFTAADSSTVINLQNGSTATALISNLGFTTTSFASGLGTGTPSALSGKVLTVKVGSAPTLALTFGAGLGQVDTLDELNNALAPANAQATIDATGKITITTNNAAGAETLTLGGSATGTGNPFLNTISTATLGGDGKIARDKLVDDYNTLLTQIDQLASDAGFNGVNLLAGDTLRVQFNETNTSYLDVKGVSTTAKALGLDTITSTDFQDNVSVRVIIAAVAKASTALQSQAATYGSNLSTVQNRQDFSKNLINILNSGSGNLTNADLNEEAANSQALSTRQSLAISALSLSNQAQQQVLQLLR
jgi:flagellin-like hook-associated protein FlgL